MKIKELIKKSNQPTGVPRIFLTNFLSVPRLLKGSFKNLNSVIAFFTLMSILKLTNVLLMLLFAYSISTW